MGESLVVWLPCEAIRENLPEVFQKAGHSKCRVIIDCSEVFIERPKSLINQAYTWSDYKHNTIKFIVGIAPTGFIMFLSLQVLLCFCHIVMVVDLQINL